MQEPGRNSKRARLCEPAPLGCNRLAGPSAGCTASDTTGIEPESCGPVRVARGLAGDARTDGEWITGSWRGHGRIGGGPIGCALILCALASIAACSRPAPQPAAEGRPEGEPLPEPAIVWQPRTYVAPRTPEPPVIDGRLDEPAWQTAAWTENFMDIEGPSRPAPKFRTRAKMLWDSNNLYVGAEIEEPDVWATLTEHDSVIYHDNDFEVFIDPDGDTHEYYELEINALGTVWDLFLV